MSQEDNLGDMDDYETYHYIYNNYDSEEEWISSVFENLDNYDYVDSSVRKTYFS